MNLRSFSTDGMRLEISVELVQHELVYCVG